MNSKISVALLLALAGTIGCGASTDNAESETHFLSCETDAECQSADADSMCVSGRCVSADEATADDDSSSGADDDGAAADDDPVDDDPAGDDDVPEPSLPTPGVAPTATSSAVPGPRPSATSTGGVNTSFPSPAPTMSATGPRPNIPAGGQGGESSEGGAAGVGGASGAGGSSTGGTDLCDIFTAEPATPEAVTITVRNERSQHIVLGGPVSCDPTHVTITSLDEDRPGAWSGSHCLLGCHLLVEGNAGCTADCPSPPPVLIPPGETATIEWPGILARTAELPEQCCEGDYCPEECPLLLTAAPGMYRAVIAVTELTEERAEACATAEPQCPNAFDGQTTFDPIEQDFEFGADPVELRVE